jgi:hypothetical protein
VLVLDVRRPMAVALEPLGGILVTALDCGHAALVVESMLDQVLVDVASVL